LAPGRRLSEDFEIIGYLVALEVSLYEITAFSPPNKRKLITQTREEKVQRER
jgi:hypothetical protein